MAIPELNEDVVATICDRLTDISDVCALSLTCSSFRSVAVKRLVSIRPIHLTGGASIQRFHAFVFADEAARAPLIHALGVDTGPHNHLLPPQPGDAALLIDILTSCQHLERISVRYIASSPMLTADPGVVDAIASIRALRSLSIESPYTVAVRLISKIDAPLRTLDLSCFQGSSNAEYSWYPATFRGSLSHVARTIQELSFRFFFVDLDMIQSLHQQEFGCSAPPLSSWQQHPSVRSLSVKCLTGALLLEPLQHLFPALDSALCVGMADLPSKEETFPDSRALNLRVQDVNNSDGWRPACRWTKLDRVDCGPATFYILALCCPIRFAIINGIYGVHAPELERDWLAESLRENPVPRLSLGLRLDNELVGLRRVFGPEMGGTLRHLTLALDSDRITSWPDPPAQISYGWGELLNKVLSLLAPLHKLTHLRVVLHSESTEDAASDSFEPLTPEQEIHRAVHPSIFDFQGTATALERPLASLRFLSLTTCGHFFLPEEYRIPSTNVLPYGKEWAASRAWRVAERSADEAQNSREQTLVELQDGEAETIIEREELILPNKIYNKSWLAPKNTD